MRVFFQTLGCKVNQYETQAMETLLTERGHTAADCPENSDVCVVNTCAVTAESGRKSRQAVRRLKSLNPEAMIAVCGCFSQISPEETAALGADIVAGSGDRKRFVEDIERVYLEKSREIITDDPMKRRAFEELPAGSVDGRTRAMLKIQDGCCNFCSYCIIPYARGPIRSMPAADVAEQARRLGLEGFREIVITGIEIASYGRDLKDGTRLGDAVRAVRENAPDCRVRLGSLEPRAVTEDFASLLASLGGVCPHFHLSLQSGCDATLKRMNRKYDTALFFNSVEIVRRHFPGCGLTADLIVGFPGETEAEFEESLAFIKKCAFSSMHIFPYSRRPGTPAASMGGQIPAKEKQARARAASAAAAEMKKAYLASCVGRTLSVLFESERGGMSFGHSGNYCETAVFGTNLRNSVSDVLINSEKNGILLGNIIL